MLYKYNASCSPASFTLRWEPFVVRTFDMIEELRQMFPAFKDAYNTTWLIERVEQRTPAVVRCDLLSPMALAA